MITAIMTIIICLPLLHRLALLLALLLLVTLLVATPHSAAIAEHGLSWCDWILNIIDLLAFFILIIVIVLI